MKPVIRIGALFCMAASLCLAETWTGKLIDANCMDQQSKTDSDQQKIAACPATKTTNAFGIVLTDGRMLRLDSAGNGKAEEAMKDATGDQPIQATVSGNLEGTVVTVDTIAIQQ